MMLSAKVFLLFAGLAGLAAADVPTQYSWVRPRTTRRYLHPPMAECMFTLWNDGVVLRGENRHRHDWQVYYGSLSADVLWLMHGAEDRPFDFAAAENRLHPDGIPFHGLTWRTDGIAVDLDAFCEVGPRAPACFVHLTFRREGTGTVGMPVALYLRRMQESVVISGTPDIYRPYETRTTPFRRAPATAYKVRSLECLEGEAATVRTYGLPPDAYWDSRKGCVRFTAKPSFGEPLSVTLTIAAPDGTARPGAWDVARDQAEAFWRGELARMNRLPPEIAQDERKLQIFRNLTIQMLQCFCHPIGSDLTIPRQGGMQRFVWPWDCKDMLAALGLIGDYGKYVEGALDLYFREYAREDGCIGPFHNDWICNTGECIASLARYCLDTDNQTVWKRHRDAAMRGFDWMRRTRASTKDGSGVVGGLFPIAEATDNPMPIQLWGFTDVLSLDALSLLSRAARRFGDPRTAEVEAERDALRDILARIYSRFSQAAADSDELRIPITPDGNDAAFLRAGYFNTNHGHLLRVGLEHGFVPTNDVMKVYTWLLRNGKADPHGLCAHHPPKDDLGNRHFWYTTTAERYWRGCFLRIGRKDLADKVLDAVLRYSMTEEFYVGERYRDDNPWYFPWSPNASGSGRIILMMLGKM